ncbi:hypothetical protein H3146_18140 [Streptomyces sp. OF3]|uniref:Uncharacterized protein n=1 Tax=Streptomyces alkaliterrae TaxID=2213162 RepID=A0A7W3WMT6_9ACTN|nr:DUF6153 family protein [Streptomyces alkaliterrae]MBB1255259.1 hypothetical protein [Streptomyces alkaliterrae]
MTSTRQLRSRLGGLGLASAILAVLVGLLGMHGLSPAGGLDRAGADHHRTADQAHPHTSSASPTAPSAATSGETAPHSATTDSHPPRPGQRAETTTRADQACSHGGGGGHPRHADGTCAAGGVSAAPALSAQASEPGGTIDVVPAFGRTAPAVSASRAPPSLAELQLLRI